MSKYEQFTNDDTIGGPEVPEVSTQEGKKENGITEFEEVNEINFELATENGKVPSKPCENQCTELKQKTTKFAPALFN